MTEFVKCILILPGKERLFAPHCRRRGNYIYAAFGTFELKGNEWQWIVNKDVKLEIIDNKLTTKDLIKQKKITRLLDGKKVC